MVEVADSAGRFRLPDNRDGDFARERGGRMLEQRRQRDPPVKACPMREPIENGAYGLLAQRTCDNPETHGTQFAIAKSSTSSDEGLLGALFGLAGGNLDD